MWSYGRWGYKSQGHPGQLQPGSAAGSGEERVKGSASRIGSPLQEGGKISMSPPICSGLTLNVNHSITMSLLISTGRRLSPENRGGNLSPKHGKWDGSGAQNPSCLQRRHRGPAGWAAAQCSYQQSDGGLHPGFLFPHLSGVWPRGFLQALSDTKRVAMRRCQDP